MPFQRFHRTLQGTMIAAAIIAAMAVRTGADLAVGMAAVHSGWVASLAGVLFDRLSTGSGVAGPTARAVSAAMTSMGILDQNAASPGGQSGLASIDRPELPSIPDAPSPPDLRAVQDRQAGRLHAGPSLARSPAPAPIHNHAERDTAEYVLLRVCITDRGRILDVRIRPTGHGEATMPMNSGRPLRTPRFWRAVTREDLST
ncbi:MAG: hypothetical protein KF787_05640 [Phycisphaeraceae bacterium]|nr:hypothetical protein [Phycisphaerae bacterium]MBX3392114.1 hypothetical protein [Phycisphaeraceae bacterium]HRJ49684.1 hypothetical protein [Phycisphaerales bacterium]